MLKFLTELFEAGCGYSSINSARSAVSAISIDAAETLGQCPLISKFMRGVFNSRPQLPRYSMTWDVNIVLTFLKNWAPAESLSLKQLSLKTTLLLLILSSQRGQTVLNFQIDTMKWSKYKVTFPIHCVLKTTRPGSHISEVAYKAFPVDKRLCVVTYVKAYIDRTAQLRKDAKQLLISFRKPYAAISRDTLARWTKLVMTMAGIDTAIFRPHSTRAASASKAAKHIPLQDILKSAGWSRETTFTKYYNKKVQKQEGTSIQDGVMFSHNNRPAGK